jgi:hypothetical protein
LARLGLGDDVETQAEDAARVARVDDAVVPQAGGGEQRRGFGVELRRRRPSLIAASAASLAGWPARSSLPRPTISITLAACAAPITAVRAEGQAKMKRGSKPRPHMP